MTPEPNSMVLHRPLHSLQDDSDDHGVDERPAAAGGSGHCGKKRPASSRKAAINHGANKRVKGSGLKMEANDDDGRRREFPSPQRYAAGMLDSAAAREPSSSSTSLDDDESDDDGFSSTSSSSGSECPSSQEEGDPGPSRGRGGKRSTQLFLRCRRLNPQTSPPLHPPGSVRSGSGSGTPDFQRLAMAQLGFSDAMLDEDEDKVRP